MRSALSLIPICLTLPGCQGTDPAPEIILLDDLDPDVIDRCVRLDYPRAFYECLIGVMPNWRIDVSSDKLMTGTVDPNPPLPEPVKEILQGVVNECQLGTTYLQSASDFGGSLLLTDQELTPIQIACVRKAERPGLHLVREEY